MSISTFEIEDPNEPQEEKPIKHKALFTAFVTATLVAPYVSGALILLQKKKLEDWGWI